MLTYAVSSSLYGLRFAKQFQPDIVQVFFGIPAGGGAYLLQKLRKVPYVVFLGGRDVPSHNPDPPYYRWLYLLLKPAIRAIWRSASTVVACSGGLRELAQETDANVKMDVIPDGLDLGRFEAVQRDAYPEKVRVLTIGRLIPRKGFQFLIRALPQIVENAAYNFEIEVVGDGPYQGELLKLSEDLGVASHIRFTGSVPYSELPQKYRDADVFILPSLAEGMPLVVLEAMGTGLPIVASRVQGIDELVVDDVNGALFEAGDVDGLAHSLVKLINAGEGRVEMGKASVERVKPYDWKHIADAYLALYAEILAKGENIHGTN
jgi:glycosyltransferase involved in cell wall biosynthesis